MINFQNGKRPHDLTINAVRQKIFYEKQKKYFVTCIIPHERGFVK